MIGARYRVVERIGSGGMAEVFRAQDEVLDRPVAVKVFRAENVAPDGAETAGGIDRQQLEVAALARLNHPNLIALYDGSLDAAPHAFIVMELIEGPSLAEQIAQGPLPEASVREIGIQLADGLAYVHAQGMVHRDVKPENILLGIDRSDDDHTVRARLSDFGIVRLLGSERLTSVNFTLGTASYLAPEQARGSAVDPPADIYSLGLVLLEALTGQRMFEGPPLEAAMARLSQRPQVPAGLPEPWPGLLHAMTEFDPAMRPNATTVARVLRNEGSRALPLVPLAVPVAAGFADAPTGMVPGMVDPVPVADVAPGATPAPAERDGHRGRAEPARHTHDFGDLPVHRQRLEFACRGASGQQQFAGRADLRDPLERQAVRGFVGARHARFVHARQEVGQHLVGAEHLVSAVDVGACVVLGSSVAPGNVCAAHVRCAHDRAGTVEQRGDDTDEPACHVVLAGDPDVIEQYRCDYEFAARVAPSAGPRTRVRRAAHAHPQVTNSAPVASMSSAPTGSVSPLPGPSGTPITRVSSHSSAISADPISAPRRIQALGRTTSTIATTSCVVPASRKNQP